MDKPLILIDGSSYIFRAFHALPPLSSPRGIPTNAIYGFTTMLLKLLKEFSKSRCAVVLDAPGPSFRDKIYPEYKANRPETPDELITQFPWIKKIVSALGIPTVEKEGYEADDIIGTLARKNESQGRITIIVTGDKDMMQVVSEKTTILDTMKNKATGKAEVREKFGVEPDKVVDVLALMGDSVDNIPGVPGIGEKTAIKLIQEFGSLDALLMKIQDVKVEKLKTSLLAHSKEAELSRRLASLELNVPLDITPEKLMIGPMNSKELDAVFRELGFLTLLKELPQETPSLKETRVYSLILTEEELGKLISTLKSIQEFSLDMETTSPEPMRAELVGISLCWREGEAFYIPVCHSYLGAPQQIKKETVIAALKPILEDPSIKKIGQNIKYDLIVLSREGVSLKGISADTMLASYLLNPIRKRHNLSDISLEYLGHKMKEFTELVPAGKSSSGFEGVPLKEAMNYSCDDAHVAFVLAKLLIPRLSEEDLDEIFRKIEMPLLEVLAHMEMVGVKVDPNILKELSQEFSARLRKIADEIYAIAGGQFNIESPRQLREVLFTKLKLPHGKKTKTGYSTDVDVLKALALEHELPRKVLDYRTFAKLKNTYLDALPNLIHPKTGRIHTSYNQTVTATGRLSSSDPNLQNIPIRGEDGKKIRMAFVPEQGFKYICADYSQIELRILAHVSGDNRLIEAFRKGEDIHKTTAIEVLGANPELILHDQRRRAKIINFGIVYGMSPYGLSQELDIPVEEAKKYIEGYFLKYPGVRAYMDATIKEARDKGYVRTLMGRKRPLPDIASPNTQVREYAERTAINTPIQGTAADLMKLVMIALHKRLLKESPPTKMILQVHDELIFEAPENEVDRVEAIVREEMEGALSLNVPLRVDIKPGDNWAESH